MPKNPQNLPIIIAAIRDPGVPQQIRDGLRESTGTFPGGFPYALFGSGLLGLFGLVIVLRRRGRLAALLLLAGRGRRASPCLRFLRQVCLRVKMPAISR